MSAMRARGSAVEASHRAPAVRTVPRRGARANARETVARAVAVASLFLFGLLGGASANAADDADASLLLRLSTPGREGRAAALADWSARSEYARVSLLRRFLQADAPDLARLAAAEIGADYLSLDEMHRCTALLGGRVEAALFPPFLRWGVGGASTVGSPDVVPLFRALAERTKSPAKTVLDGLSRTAVPDEIPDLVPLLDRGDDEYVRSLLSTISSLAVADRRDRYRGWVARALDYGLRVRAGAPRPALEPGPLPLSDGPGLPAAFRAIASALWGFGEGADTREGSVLDLAAVPALQGWLRRWAHGLEPVDADGFFVTDLVRADGVDVGMRFWAMKHLLRLSPDWGGRVVGDLAAGTDDAAAAASAALALAGRPDAWTRMLALDEPPGPVAILAWAVDPESARRRWLEALVKTDALRGSYVFDLSPLARQQMASAFSVRIRDEDLRWIADRLREGAAPPGDTAFFFARVLPRALTPAEVGALAHRLEDLPSVEGKDFSAADVPEDVLGWLEVGNPDALKRLLGAWLPLVPRDDRARVLAWLARLGDTAHVDEMVRTWSEGSDRELRRDIGHVADPRVEAMLLQRLAGDDRDEAELAFLALAVERGIPDAVFEGGCDFPEPADDASWARAVGLMSRGDAVGAILAWPPDVGRLGLVKDPRVVAALRSVRSERGNGLYWEATAGLALLGDAEARSEMLGLVREGHTWLFDRFDDPLLLSLDGDPEVIAAWVAHVESNCCLGWQAQQVLRARFPTLPLESDAGGTTTSAEAAAWLAAHEGRLRHSRILGGWIPGPGAD